MRAQNPTLSRRVWCVCVRACVRVCVIVAFGASCLPVALATLLNTCECSGGTSEHLSWSSQYRSLCILGNHPAERLWMKSRLCCRVQALRSRRNTSDDLLGMAARQQKAAKLQRMNSVLGFGIKEDLPITPPPVSPCACVCVCV